MLLATAKQLEIYKRNYESLQQQSARLSSENQRMLNQLQSLFSLYNMQKATIETLKKTAEAERKALKEQTDREKRLRAEQLAESETHVARYKSVAEEMEQRLQSLESRLTSVEEEKHKLILVNIDVKEQLRNKEKRVLELEYCLESTKTKLEREVEALARYKEQSMKDKRYLEKQLETAQKEAERQTEEGRRLHKEVVKLSYSNEELAEEVRRWKRKYSAARTTERRDDSIGSPNTQRLAEIEQKLEVILKNQRNDSSASRVRAEQSPEQESQNTEEDDDEESLEELLKNLAGQILQKDELKNANIIRMFKLDQIQLNDKENEYKNLLRALGALYFANKHSKLLHPLFSHWKEKWRQKTDNVNSVEKEGSCEVDADGSEGFGEAQAERREGGFGVDEQYVDE